MKSRPDVADEDVHDERMSFDDGRISERRGGVAQRVTQPIADDPDVVAHRSLRTAVVYA